MIITDYYFEVPATLNVDNVFNAISQKDDNFEYPMFPMAGTHAVAGKAILHIRFRRLILKAALDTMIANNSLNWTVLGIRSAEKIDPVIQGDGTTIYKHKVYYFAGKSAIINYMNKIWDGVIYRPPTLADTISLSTYFGSDPVSI